MKFLFPYFLLLLLLIPVYLISKYYIFFKKNISLEPTIYYSSLKLFSNGSFKLGLLYKILMDFLIILSLFFFIIALARPVGSYTYNYDENYGIDIILLIDVSGSMLSIDTIPHNAKSRTIFGKKIFYDENGEMENLNRMNIAKKVIMEYIDKQYYNRIGIVVFAGYSYTKCPLTLDKQVLKDIIQNIKFNPDNDGTAIGMGIMTSINRLKKSNSKSKVIILLTDGINNAGYVSPLKAAETARNMNIRIYTIGIGNPDGYLAPVDLNLREYIYQVGIGIDEEVLRKIAEITKGKFYKAYVYQELNNIYSDIDKLEKSKINIKRKISYKENFMPFLLIGSFFLILYILLNGIVIKIP